MVNVIPRSGRIAAVLLGAVLVTASISIGGPAAATVAAGHGSAGHSPVAGVHALLRHGAPGGSPIPVAGHPWPGPVPTWPAAGPSGHTLALPAGVPAVPAPGSASELHGIFCPSATNCWAVGTYYKGQVSLDEVLHWNGLKWTQIAAPSPGGTSRSDFSKLLGGRCTAASNCWAVGVYGTSGSDELDLVLHWNGTKWSKVAAPSPGGTGTGSASTLVDVACRSSNSCWAAGEYSISGVGTPALRNNVLHWNGTKWVQVTVPNPAGTANGDVNSLASIRCPANNDCWAVGTTGVDGSTYNMLNQALHWDGTTWIQATIPSPGGTADGDFSMAYTMACTSYANCWVGGYYGNVLDGTPYLNQALHWDGTGWTQAAVPQPGGTTSGDDDVSVVLSIDCASPSDCWAVGQYIAPSSSPQLLLNQALHWDGTSWTQVIAPGPGPSSKLNAVHCTGPALCWAVGDSDAGTGTSELGEVLRWNGSTWSTG